MKSYRVRINDGYVAITPRCIVDWAKIRRVEEQEACTALVVTPSIPGVATRIGSGASKTRVAHTLSPFNRPFHDRGIEIASICELHSLTKMIRVVHSVGRDSTIRNCRNFGR